MHAFGRSWDVKRGWGGPGPNVWSDDPAAVFVDNVTGALHLKASATTSRKSNARVFNCTEVSLPTPLGYAYESYRVYADVRVAWVFTRMRSVGVCVLP